MIDDRVYIICAGYPDSSEDTQRLYQVLEAVKRPDEYIFSTVPHAYHADVRLFDDTPPSVPCVAFIRIGGIGTSRNLKLSDALAFIKRHLPCAIFVLYGTTEEHQALLSGQIEKDHEKYIGFYFLEKDEEFKFSVVVRSILDVARTASEKRARVKRFHTAFLSYSHQDEKFAQWLHGYLKSFGIDCWLDRKDLKAGDMIHRSIEAAIEGNDKLLLCASTNSLTSWWVDNEINSAILKEQEIRKRQKREGLVLIPLNLDGYLFADGWSNGWKAQIVSRLAPDFTKWEKFVDFDLKHGDERMEDLRKIEQQEGYGFTSRFYQERERVVKALYIPEADS